MADNPGTPVVHTRLPAPPQTKASVSANDKTFGYLAAKLASGANVSFVVLFPGQDEQLQINVFGVPGGWQRYEPIVSGDGVGLGDGRVGGLWRACGPDAIDVQIEMVVGSTAVAAAAVAFSLPKAADLGKLLPSGLVPGGGVVTEGSGESVVRPLVNNAASLRVLVVGGPSEWPPGARIYLHATVPVAP